MSYYFAQPRGLDSGPKFPFADTEANSFVVMTRTLRRVKRTFISPHQVLRSTYTKSGEDFTARSSLYVHHEGPISILYTLSYPKIHKAALKSPSRAVKRSSYTPKLELELELELKPIQSIDPRSTHIELGLGVL